MTAPPGAGPEALGGGPGRVPFFGTERPEPGRRERSPPAARLRSMRGIPRAPGRRPAPLIPRFEEASRKMERHPKQLHVRMSDREMESAKGLARELGMTVSDLVRVLLQLPAEEVRGEARLVVVDRMNLNLPQIR